MIRATPGLTLSLLAFMMAIGIICGAWGFTFGRKALKGITQPAISSGLGGSGSQTKQSQQGTTFLREADILEQVEAEVSGSKEGSARANSDEPGMNTGPSSSMDSNDAQTFPVKSQDQDVVFEVRSAQRQGNQLILDVALTNDGSRSVQFLYTFLDVTDEQDRVLSATTTGLPAELEPNGETFSGTITIPNTSLGNAQKLSLKLQDYPERDVKLEVSDIPVTR